MEAAIEIPREVPELEDEDSWRDVRALLIFREEDLVQSSRSRREILHRRVVAHVGTKEEWMQLLHMTFYEEGVYTAREVIIVADGGQGIWETFEELLRGPRSARLCKFWTGTMR